MNLSFNFKKYLSKYRKLNQLITIATNVAIRETRKGRDPLLVPGSNFISDGLSNRYTGQ